MNELENKEHITLSSSFIEELVIKHIEEKFGKQVEKTKWITDDQFGFAGFRLIFFYK